MLTILQTPTNKYQNNFAFTAKSLAKTSVGLQNDLPKIKARPETAMKLSLMAALAPFLTKFFTIDAKKNSDRVATPEEIEYAMVQDTINNTDADTMVASLSEEDFLGYVNALEKDGFIVETREDLATIIKDSKTRYKHQYLMNMAKSYSNELQERINSGNMTAKDKKFVDGIAKAKKNFEKEINKFEIIG